MQRLRRRDEPTWWLGWGALALEVAAVVVAIAAWFVWWGLWVVSVVAYLGGGLAGAVAVILGTGAAPRGGGWKPGLAVLLFVIITLCLSVLALPILFGGGG